MTDDPRVSSCSEQQDTEDLHTGGIRLGLGARHKYFAKQRARNQDDKKYDVQEKLAEGGMGEIYRVYDRCLKRELVTKVILPHVAEDSVLFERFVAEAQITGKLEHPNIVPVHDMGVMANDKLYFSMKYVSGVSLGEIVKGVRDEDPAYDQYTRFRLLTIFRKVCDAVAFAHSHRVLHRDIKPDNIMVGAFGEVLLMDWGLAKETEAEEGFEAGEETDPEDVAKTRYGVVKGTPAFMSPEQAKGLSEQLDERSDIFLLGATLYALATCSTPFTGDDIYEILANAESGNFISPALKAPERELPLELCRIILQAMAYDQDERYQTVQELSEDVDALLAGNTTSIRRFFEPGDMVIHEGDIGREAYVMISGEVEVFQMMRGKEVRLITLGEGDVIGEMALISDFPRSASIRALQKTEVFVITEEVLKQGLDQLPPWIGTIIDCLAERLRVANANIHPLMSGDCSYHILQQLRYIYLLHGAPSFDAYTECHIIAIPTQETILEISSSLCISREQIELAIARLLKANLPRPVGPDHLSIPNFDLFGEFLAFVAETVGISGGFGSQPDTALFAQAGEFVIRHASPQDMKEEGELEAVPTISEEKLLRVATRRTRDRFVQILAQMQLANSSPSAKAKPERHRVR